MPKANGQGGGGGSSRGSKIPECRAWNTLRLRLSVTVFVPFKLSHINLAHNNGCDSLQRHGPALQG